MKRAKTGQSFLKEESEEQKPFFSRLKGLIEERLNAKRERKKEALFKEFRSASPKLKEKMLRKMSSKKGLWDLRIIEEGLREKQTCHYASSVLIHMIEKGLPREGAIGYFRELAMSSENSRKKTAIYALGLIGGKEEVPILADSLKHYDYSLRFQARDSLIEMGLRGVDVSEQLEKFIPMVSSKDPEEVKVGLLALEVIGGPDHLFLVLSLITSGQKETKEWAEEALAFMINRGIDTKPLYNILKNILKDEVVSAFQPTLEVLEGYAKRREGKVASFALALLKEHFHSEHMSLLKKKDPSKYNRESMRLTEVLEAAKKAKMGKANK